MIRKYCCEKFDGGMKAVNGPIELQSVRTGFRYAFDQEYVFQYCPWCGTHLGEKQLDPKDEHWNAFAKIGDPVDEDING